ncbi:endoribonuclease L-PSP [Oceanicola sp. 22II-s10i]|uniref:RidA family protein n=1 Tax=Oceanicola sp. 22II-s10i TaxID=1317116 RepID=UPI000B5271FF|nr:RidA family protein [Oceanicola sp. 22II-s10i]OWU85275.1 endoribonuclease L-PSP [Oceanicola sp. 22II-s10i]
MTHRRIHSGSAFEPKMAYCRAVVTADGWVHVAGTVGQGATVVDQCRAALDTIGKALAEAGAQWSDVVRVHYILPDRTEFEPCWPVLAEVFGAHPPAATMFEAGLIDPVYRIEIEVTAKIAGSDEPGR